MGTQPPKLSIRVPTFIVNQSTKKHHQKADDLVIAVPMLRMICADGSIQSHAVQPNIR
jgi:hypothetical protein